MRSISPDSRSGSRVFSSWPSARYLFTRPYQSPFKLAVSSSGGYSMCVCRGEKMRRTFDTMISRDRLLLKGSKVMRDSRPVVAHQLLSKFKLYSPILILLNSPSPDIYDWISNASTTQIATMANHVASSLSTCHPSIVRRRQFSHASSY